MKVVLGSVLILFALLVGGVVWLWALPASSSTTIALALASEGERCRVDPDRIERGDGVVWVPCDGAVHQLTRHLDCSELPPCSLGFEHACWSVQKSVPQGALPDGVWERFGLE